MNENEPPARPVSSKDMFEARIIRERDAARLELEQARAALAAIREALPYQDGDGLKGPEWRIRRILEQTGLPLRAVAGAEPERARLLRVEAAARDVVKAMEARRNQLGGVDTIVPLTEESEWSLRLLVDALDGGGEKT